MGEEKRIIKWKAAAFKGNPELVYRELESMGEYTPDDVLEYARTYEDSELHKCFDWDDTIAAEKWRKQQARLICGSLSVVIQTEYDHEPQTFRLIQHDREEGVYRSVQMTVRNEDQYARLLRRAKEELEAFRQRYASIVELTDIIEEIDKLLNN